MKKNIKKTISILGVFSVLFFTLGAGSASASWSSWQKLKGKSGCEVRVWTDYNNYYKGAGTVDAKAQQRGGCGTLHYNMSIYDWNLADQSLQKGYFSNVTPVKYLNIKGNPAKITTHVGVSFWSDSARKNRVGDARSNSITIYPQ
jgi:hypothetical protein